MYDATRDSRQRRAAPGGPRWAAKDTFLPSFQLSSKDCLHRHTRSPDG